MLRVSEFACGPASGVPSSTVPGPSTEFSGLSGVSAPTDPVSSVAGSAVGGLGLSTAPLSDKASGVCEEPAPAMPVSSLLVAEKQDFMQHHSLVGCRVPPRPVDAGADPGGTVVTQAAATGWPSFSESSVATLGAVGALARDATEVALQVGIYLQQHWQEWENIWACKWVVKILQYDYIFPFLRDPPLSSTPVEFPAYREAVVLDTVRAQIFPLPDWVNRFKAVAQQFLLAEAPPVSL
ncbi:hypothetical protein E2C01_041921 [Portunus trituberculatus]|uniref:Uncharacterized protein n=1 Tax=Portunus trituberculatus TaxID=210409 RepID=A0A5B7FSZ1_PORTR|nr:hypothetical protein [Portunus trituberculatus]